MKFTLSWLKTHLDIQAGIEEIGLALTDLGLEVEEIGDPAATLGAFRIARVIEASQHPNADRLRVCRVEVWPDGPDGTSEEVQVVCGAPNARTGLLGVFAPPGTHVPGTGVDLKPGVIRGVESNGMLCSERELMLSDDHDGIIDLPADAPLGARYIDWAGLNDPVIEIAITPNRPDALGVAGIARDLAARGLGQVITPGIDPVPGAFPCPVRVTLDADVAPRACPLFAGRVIRGVTNGPSPAWLQRQLRAIGLRPISALVDITNFMTFDRNRPLHVFDADLIKGAALRVAFADGGEQLLALDDKTYVFEPGMLAIRDAEGVESLAGIMGGKPTGCTEATVNVFVESAYWDPTLTAATGRRLRINSDARYRFERGVDPAFTLPGLEMATRMILDLCGGTPSELVVAGAVPETARSYPLRPERVISLVGMDIPAGEQIRILTDLGFEVSGSGRFDVAVPSWRPDIGGEADLVEEVARVASLTKLEAQPLPRPSQGITRRTLTAGQKRAGRIRRALAARGANECVSYAFISAKEAASFGGGDAAVALENPISSEMSHMRPSPLPGLAAAAARNQARGFADLALFELGQGFAGGEPGEEEAMAVLLRLGSTAPRSPYGARRPVDVMDAKADALDAVTAAGAPADRLMVLRDDLPGWLHPGRAGWLCLGPKLRLALIGELHPQTLAACDLRGPAVVALVYPDRVPPARAKGTTRAALDVSDLQAVERDFAFVVDARCEAETVLRAARGADKALIARADLFDVFAGPQAEAQLGAGKKSLAIAVRLEPRQATLTEEDIDAVAQKVVAAVAKASGGTLRS
ncbi:MAG: phenylalanine--tRNA ligase subunit beta [Pseudomonadota bacterium]